MPQQVIIVGAGQAGFQVAASLRAKAFDGAVTIVGEEAAPPYQRPPLSKGYIKGEASETSVLLRPAEFYATHKIDLRVDTRVTAIDRAHAQVTLADGATLPYDSLVLATGARVRKLPVPGADLAGVVYVRTLPDAVTLKRLIAAANNVVVIGGGFIGLECAAVAATLGRKTTVLEAADRLMARVVSPVLSAYYLGLHRGHGVDVRLGVTVTDVLGTDGKVSGVPCGNGTVVPADLVVVGIGVIPNDELAKAAGLACERGIVADTLLRTADPNIYAIGDCAAFPHPMTPGLARLESVQNAVDQGKAVADAILGEARPYTAVPWFWSDQYDAKLQIVGICQDYDEPVTLGDTAEGRFSVLYFTDGGLIGIDSVNKAGDHMAGRKLLAAGKTVTLAQAREAGFDLRAAAK
ncbi:MAG: pyridine nucleotide-disulfide oxidoreductase [Rhizobiales bacterium]|nr:pyridine nucleotide-disulfide oxidoreductase [Hyphomicrobiales bacterium]